MNNDPGSHPFRSLRSRLPLAGGGNYPPSAVCRPPSSIRNTIAAMDGVTDR
jgi:hypothetical protein